MSTHPLFRRLVAPAALALAAVLGSVLPAAAQSFGIGPTLSLVRGDLSTNTPTSRLFGGSMRMVTGHHTEIEVSMDYRSYLDASGTRRTREVPLQASLLLFPVRAAFAPYVGGGIGVYSQINDVLGVNNTVTSSTTDRKIGWHLGAGAEVRVTRHAAFFADYRFRFVKFGAPADSTSQPLLIPGSSVIPGLDKVQLSHQGSMWTTGVAFYF